MNSFDAGHIRYFRTAYQDYLLRIKTDMYETLRFVIKKKVYLNDHINEEIESRINGKIENFVTVLLIGKQGTFKTSCELTFCEMFDKAFNISKVAFLYQEFNNLISNSQPNETFCMDEQVFKHGIGSVRAINDMQNNIETLRKRKNSMVVTGVDDKYFPMGIFTFLFETIDSAMMGTCYQNSKEHEVRLCPVKEKEHEIKHLFVRLAVKEQERYIGLYTVKILWNNQLWKDYEIKKNEFLEKAKSGSFGNIDYDGVAKELFNDNEHLNYKSINDFKLLIIKKFPNLSTQEIDLLARQMKIYKKDKEG